MRPNHLLVIDDVSQKVYLIMSMHIFTANTYKDHCHMGETLISLAYVSQPCVIKQYLLQYEGSNLKKQTCV